MPTTNTRTKIKPNLAVKRPSMYKVLYMNDEVTTVTYVAGSLIKFFGHDEASAGAITLKIHEEGSAVVAILSYELAEQRGLEVTMDARAHGFPLQVKIEADN